MDGNDTRPPAPHGASPDGPIGGADGAFDFLPKDFDWKNVALDTVRRHPVPCLLGAVAVGFLVGRHRGKAIATALSAVATNTILRELNRAFSSEEF